MSETPHGRPPGVTEKDDCAVRAMVLVTGMPYATLHTLAGLAGRNMRGTMSTRQIMTLVRAVKYAGVTIHKVRLTKRRRLGTFCTQFPKGKFYVVLRSHVLAVVDGKITDGTKPTYLVQNAWRILTKERVPDE